MDKSTVHFLTVLVVSAFLIVLAIYSYGCEKNQQVLRQDLDKLWAAHNDTMRMQEHTTEQRNHVFEQQVQQQVQRRATGRAIVETSEKASIIAE